MSLDVSGNTGLRITNFCRVSWPLSEHEHKLEADGPSLAVWVTVKGIHVSGLNEICGGEMQCSGA
jgi:hypothetical protein